MRPNSTSFVRQAIARARAFRPRAKVIWFNVAAVLLILAALEGYLRVAQPGLQLRQEFAPSEAIFVRDPVLGHRPQAGARIRSQGYYGSEQTYDVAYTIDDQGLRISPPDTAANGERCVLFFGCSFTFGEGVDDQQTMPYRVGLKTHYRVRNFGFRAYGPQHMLAAIESGFVRQAARCRPTDAVFWTNSHHLRRAAGKWSWDRYGPRYALLADGTVRRDGSFADDAARTTLINSSQMGVEMVDRAPLTAADRELYLAILARARELLEAEYPGLVFHVVWWDEDMPELYEGWRRRGLLLYRMADDLPLTGDVSRYHLPHDGHPNAATLDAAADYIVHQVLENPAGAIRGQAGSVATAR